MSELDNLHNAETQDTSYDHVLRYTGVFGGVQGLKLAMSVLRNKLTSVLLGSVGIGLISIYSSISDFMVSCCNFGLPLNATRISGELFENGTKEQIEHFVALVRTYVLWSAILAATLCALFSPLLSYVFFEHDWRHFPDIMMVIPVIVCFLVAEGECALLKGLRQVKKVAIIETMIAILTVLFTLPFYYMWGLKGVILGLIASGAASVVTHFHYSLRLVGYRLLPASMNTLREGLPMIKKGIPYVLAGIANSGLTMAIPAILLINDTMSQVGYFRAGYALIVGYAGMAFVALEADYFPRLSSVCHDHTRMNEAVNRQVDVCILFLTPLLILLQLLMPWIIRLLYTQEFLVIHDMTVLAVFYTFLRSVYLPMGFIPLAKGDSMLYLVMELAYDIFFGLLIYILYTHYGLIGAGIALSLGAVYDLASSLLVYGYKYGCRIRRSTWLICVVQFVLLLGVCLCSLMPKDNELTIKFILGGVAFVASMAFSIWNLSKRSDFVRHILGHFLNSSGNSGSCCR